MSILPKIGLLFIFYFLLFATPTFAVERVGTIDPNDPSWGEDIELKTRAIVTPDDEIAIEGKVEVGPQKDQLKFPDLTQLNNTLGESLQFLLPASLYENLNLPGEQELDGKIFHPICRVTRVKTGEKIPIGESSPSQESTTVKTPPYWSNFLALTKLSQAIGVPGVSSELQFQITKPEINENEQNLPLADCPQPKGPTKQETVVAKASGQTIISFDLLTSVVQFFQGILDQLIGKKPETVEVIVKPKKFIPGEAEFAKQTSEEMGFLRSFCPEKLCPTVLNEQEDTPYKDEDDGTKRLEYKGVAGAREGHKLLLDSLYPAELQVNRPLPSIPPLPIKPGSGIFKQVGNPNSQELEIKILQAAVAFGVPPAVLAGVAWVEGGYMWIHSDGQIAAYSAPGAEDPKQCQTNGCAARGPMQITYGVATDCLAHTGKFLDSWTSVSNAYNEATGENRTTNICNIADSIYAAAKLLKLKVGLTQSADWNQQEVFRAVGRYYGDECIEIHPRLGSKSYCQFVWDNYK